MDKKYDEFFNFIVNKKSLTYEINNNGSIDVFNEDIFLEIDDGKNYDMYIHKRVDYIPPNTRFYENIYMSESNNLKGIGINFDVNADLHILSCENLESVGKGLRAVNLYIEGSHKFNKLPDNTRILEKIKLEEANIQEFGKNIKTQKLEIGNESIIIGEEKHDNYSIKNIENLEAEELIICYDMRLKNINKIKNLKKVTIDKTRHTPFEIKEKCPSYQKRKQIESGKIVLDYEMTEEFLKSIKERGHKNTYRNYLDFKSPNSFCSKLINEEYDLITKEDIQECILLDNRKVLIGENKIPIDMVNYCVHPKAILYLKQSDYEFTKEGLSTIIDPLIKSNYENVLIERELKIESEDEKQYKQTAKQIKKSF